jgi:hypothetical protein
MQTPSTLVFSEEVYDRAMQVGLRLAKCRYENQKVVELKYRITM